MWKANLALKKINIFSLTCNTKIIVCLRLEVHMLTDAVKLKINKGTILL